MHEPTKIRPLKNECSGNASKILRFSPNRQILYYIASEDRSVINEVELKSGEYKCTKHKMKYGKIIDLQIPDDRTITVLNKDGKLVKFDKVNQAEHVKLLEKRMAEKARRDRERREHPELFKGKPKDKELTDEEKEMNHPEADLKDSMVDEFTCLCYSWEAKRYFVAGYHFEALKPEDKKPPKPEEEDQKSHTVNSIFALADDFSPENKNKFILFGETKCKAW